MYDKMLLFVVVIAAFGVTAARGCDFPPDHPSFSGNESQNEVEVFNTDLVYVYTNEFEDCHGCVTQLSVCYRPSQNATVNQTILTVIILSNDDIIVHTHDLTVNTIRNNIEDNLVNCEENTLVHPYCCVTEVLEHSKQFEVENSFHYALRTYSEASAPLQHLTRVTPGYIILDSALETTVGGSIVGGNDSCRMPFFFFTISQGECSTKNPSPVSPFLLQNVTKSRDIAVPFPTIFAPSQSTTYLSQAPTALQKFGTQNNWSFSLGSTDINSVKLPQGDPLPARSLPPQNATPSVKITTTSQRATFIQPLSTTMSFQGTATLPLTPVTQPLNISTSSQTVTTLLKSTTIPLHMTTSLTQSSSATLETSPTSTQTTTASVQATSIPILIYTTSATILYPVTAPNEKISTVQYGGRTSVSVHPTETEPQTVVTAVIATVGAIFGALTLIVLALLLIFIAWQKVSAKQKEESVELNLSTLRNDASIPLLSDAMDNETITHNTTLVQKEASTSSAGKDYTPPTAFSAVCESSSSPSGANSAYDISKSSNMPSRKTQGQCESTTDSDDGEYVVNQLTYGDVRSSENTYGYMYITHPQH